MKTVIIIPALNPDEKLNTLVREIKRLSDNPIFIVDDGSIPSRRPLFDDLERECGCIIAHHPINKGKGAALKTGITLAVKTYPDLAGYVTADADGQHLPEDIIHLSEALAYHPDSLILGVRDFSQSNVPFKSRWGNRITSFIFYMSNGIHCSDTQTGLRAIPVGLTHMCLSVLGDRFEYEMNVLTTAAKRGIKLIMLPIKTVYTDKNKSSHFHPVLDSIRIYAGIIRFGIASIISASADLLFFTMLIHLFFERTATGILASTILARCASGVLNFSLNKFWSFDSKGNTVKQAYKYIALFIVQMLFSWGIVTLLSYIPANITLLKMIADSGLFILSYFFQKTFIFNRTNKK